MSLLSSALKLPDFSVSTLIAIHECGALTPNDLQKLLGVSPASAFRSLAALRNAGLVARFKGGKYDLIERPAPPISKKHAPNPLGLPPVIIGSTLPSHLRAA